MKDKKSFIDKIDELVAKLDERNPKNDFIFLAIMFCFVVLFMLFGGIFQTALSNSTKETQTFFTILFIVFLALPLIMTLYDKYQKLKASIKKLCEPKDFLQDENLQNAKIILKEGVKYCASSYIESQIKAHKKNKKEKS